MNPMRSESGIPGPPWRDEEGTLRMYKLYWAQDSGAMAPQALLEEIGAEYEKLVIDFEKDEHRSDEFLSVNPMGQIPALVLPDGTLMTETAAILLQIVDLHPEAQLAPTAGSTERARFLRWLFFLASNLYPAILRIYYAQRYSTDPNAADGIKVSAEAELNHHFGIIDDALDPGPYLLGEMYSAVDIFLWMLIQWHPAPDRLFENAERIKRVAGLIQARPAIARTWLEHEED
jgi:glutathione S-transferase